MEESKKIENRVILTLDEYLDLINSPKKIINKFLEACELNEEKNDLNFVGYRFKDDITLRLIKKYYSKEFDEKIEELKED